MIQDVQMITENVNRLAQLFAGMEPSKSTVDPLKNVSDKCMVMLEELRTLQILTESHSEGLGEQLNVVEKSVGEMSDFFDRIDEFNKFLTDTKSNLTKLEKLCNVINRQ
uniref:Uncharacterized protein n=1 Tax=Caenorhabditis japonica TaxID=281687 RepID=A0A8R1HM29_CAEJA